MSRVLRGIPVTVTSRDGTTGTLLVDLSPGDKGYEEWLAFFEKREKDHDKKWKHYGPDEHPGTGSPQEVHGGEASSPGTMRISPALRKEITTKVKDILRIRGVSISVGFRSGKTIEWTANALDWDWEHMRGDVDYVPLSQLKSVETLAELPDRVLLDLYVYERKRDDSGELITNVGVAIANGTIIGATEHTYEYPRLQQLLRAV